MEDKTPEDYCGVPIMNLWTKTLFFFYNDGSLPIQKEVHYECTLGPTRHSNTEHMKAQYKIPQRNSRKKTVYPLPNNPANVKNMKKDTRPWMNTSVIHTHRRNNEHPCIASSNKPCRTMLQQMTNGQSA